MPTRLCTENSAEEPTVTDTTAFVSDRAVISDKNVVIGKNVVIEPNVVINENVCIKDNVIIHAGCVIGGKSFNFARSRKGELVGWIDAGKTVIGENVEICPLAHIAQGCLEDDVTLLKDNCRIDSFVHIGHSARIGERAMISAGAVIGGNSVIGDDAWVGINATVSNRITVGNNARVSLGSVVTRNVGDSETVTGNFAVPHERFIEILKNNLN